MCWGASVPFSLVFRVWCLHGGLRWGATRTVSTEWQSLFVETKVALGIARPVRLMHSALVNVPTVIGWLRPAVLIPVGCVIGISQVQMETVFAHERTHTRGTTT